jgi:hypothetical protein
VLSGVDALFLDEVLQPLHANQSFPSEKTQRKTVTLVYSTFHKYAESRKKINLCTLLQIKTPGLQGPMQAGFRTGLVRFSCICDVALFCVIKMSPQSCNLDKN